LTEQNDLEQSIKSLGVLVPLIKNKRTGHLIDGKHRIKIQSDTPIFEIDIDEDLEPLARLAINNVRRNASEDNDEWTEILSSLSRMKPEEIATKTGISIRTIYRHMPQELKKPEAEAISEGMKSQVMRKELTPVSSSIKTSDTRHPINDLVSCDNCKIATHISKMKALDDQDLCPSCFERLSKTPKVPQNIVTEYDKARANIVKDSWENRKARMQPQHSKIEDALLTKLTELGCPFEIDRAFCLQSTIPDFYFPNKNLAVYVDGEVHNGKQDRDETLRELLTKRHGIRVISIPYKTFTKEKVNRVFKVISEEA
jgi:very-short-patch-repair endonuclease